MIIIHMDINNNEGKPLRVTARTTTANAAATTTTTITITTTSKSI